MKITTRPAALALLTAALAFTLPLAGTAHAEVYKWVDANGRTQFSDKPPPDQKNVKQLDLKERPISPAERAAAEQRAALERNRSENQRNSEAKAKSTNQAAADPDEGKSELQKSEECYARYRTTTGRLLPEAGEKCKEVKIP
jgi:hypothetical protein